MDNTIIFDATNNTQPFIDILSQVPEGNGYIWTGRRFIQKTGWRSSKLIDWRHIDHSPHRAELEAYALEMANAARLYKAALVAIAPLVGKLVASVNQIAIERPLDEYDYFGAGR